MTPIILVGTRRHRPGGGRPSPVSEPVQIDDPRFAVDCMLGSLAKWLKILGYDTFYLTHVEDAELVERARAEGRVLLTRDRRMTLRRRARPCHFVTSEDPREQIREVVTALGLRVREELFLTRCLPCNARTNEIPRDKAAGSVPAYVLDTQTRFRRCPSCGRIYWGATHRERMVERLREIFPKTP